MALNNIRPGQGFLEESAVENRESSGGCFDVGIQLD